MHRHQPPVSLDRRSRGRALIVFGPLLAVGAIIALLAMAMGLYGWRPDEMRLVAEGLGGVVMLLAVALFYGQARQRRFSDQSLHNMEARVGGIVESAMDAIVTVDEHQRVVLFNAAAEKVFRRPRATVLGQKLDILIPERLRHAHHKHIDRFGATGVTSRRMGDATVLVGLRANNEEFPIEASISQHSENGMKLFTVILRDVTERVRADEALRRSKEELRELASVGSSIREQEKSRIARELHDELAQALTALKMDLNWVKDTLPLHEGQIVSKLEAMQIMVDGTVKATRRIAADLRPLMLDDLGLIPAAEWLVKNFTQRTGIPCDFSADPPGLELQDPHATAIFRILQESLANVAKHAQASTVDVTVDMGEGEITLKIRDNGCGFDPGHARKPNSFGLVGLRERAYLLDGEVAVDSAPGKGTVIEVHIPLSRTTTAP